MSKEHPFSKQESSKVIPKFLELIKKALDIRFPNKIDSILTNSIVIQSEEFPHWLKGILILEGKDIEDKMIQVYPKYGRVIINYGNNIFMLIRFENSINLESNLDGEYILKGISTHQISGFGSAIGGYIPAEITPESIRDKTSQKDVLGILVIYSPKAIKDHANAYFSPHLPVELPDYLYVYEADADRK